MLDRTTAALGQTALTEPFSSWIVKRQCDLSFVHWDGEYVLFDNFAGHTYYLDTLAFQIFTRIYGRPIASLLDNEAEACTVEIHEPADEMSIRIDHLFEVGLIEAA